MFNLAKNPAMIATAATMLGLKPEVMLARVNEFETFIRNSAKLIYDRVNGIETLQNRITDVLTNQAGTIEELKESLAALQTQHALFMTTISRLESLADGVTPAGDSDWGNMQIERVETSPGANFKPAPEVQTVGHLRGVYPESDSQMQPEMTHGNGD